MPKLARPAKRPRKGRAGKLYPLNMRTTAEIRSRLLDAAHASGRSLAQEVEYRVELSFRHEDELGGAQTAALLRELAAIARTETGERDWLKDYRTFQVVAGRWRRRVDDMAPAMPTEVESEIRAAEEWIAGGPDYVFSNAGLLAPFIANGIAHNPIMPEALRNKAASLIVALNRIIAARAEGGKRVETRIVARAEDETQADAKEGREQ